MFTHGCVSGCFSEAKKKPNFTAIALHGNPAGGSGRKGSAPPRKRKSIAFSSTTRVDRLESPSPVVSRSATIGNTTARVHSLESPGPSFNMITATVGNASQVCSTLSVNISLSSLAGPLYSHTLAFTCLFGLLHAMTEDTNPCCLISHLVCPLISENRTCLLTIICSYYASSSNDTRKCTFQSALHFWQHIQMFRLWQQLCLTTCATL